MPSDSFVLLSVHGLSGINSVKYRGLQAFDAVVHNNKLFTYHSKVISVSFRYLQKLLNVLHFFSLLLKKGTVKDNNNTFCETETTMEDWVLMFIIIVKVI